MSRASRCRVDRAVCWLVLGATWIGMTASACRKEHASPREPVAIRQVIDRTPGKEAGGRFDIDRARLTIESAIKESHSMEWVEEGGPKIFHAQLDIVLFSEGPNEGSDSKEMIRRVDVDFSIERWNEAEEREKFFSRGKAVEAQNAEKVDTEKGMSQLLDKAILQSVRLLDIQLETRFVPQQRLAEMLQASDPEDRLYVLKSLRDRSAPELIDKVIQMLSDPEPAVAMEAVGVLVAQKDQRAVLPLIQMSRGHDQVFLLQQISALGEIGGTVAQGYLFTLSAGHPSRLIRERAGEALRQAEERTTSISETQPVVVTAKDRTGVEEKKNRGDP
jgi:hypothetical protein